VKGLKGEGEIAVVTAIWEHCQGYSQTADQTEKGGGLPWECPTLRFIKNTSDCRPNWVVTATLNYELVILSPIPILWSYLSLVTATVGPNGDFAKLSKTAGSC
jgi:hypothetical protein